MPLRRELRAGRATARSAKADITVLEVEEESEESAAEEEIARSLVPRESVVRENVVGIDTAEVGGSGDGGVGMKLDTPALEASPVADFHHSSHLSLKSDSDSDSSTDSDTRSDSEPDLDSQMLSSELPQLVARLTSPVAAQLAHSNPLQASASASPSVSPSSHSPAVSRKTHAATNRKFDTRAESGNSSEGSVKGDDEIREGQQFISTAAAVEAVKAAEEQRGMMWRIDKHEKRRGTYQFLSQRSE